MKRTTQLTRKLTPHIRAWGQKHPKVAATLYQLARRSFSALLTTVAMAACVALTIFSLGIRIPLLQGSSHADGITAKPKLVTSTQAAPQCNPALSQANALFSVCPSFSADYSNQQKGSINTNEFNTYSGPVISNHEAEYYTDNSDNLRIENGNLVLEARPQATQGYKYTSARIDTHGKEDFLYGKLVVRATLPDGIGTWPAIWMLPSQPKYAQLSPASDLDRYLNDGEIDVAESVGIQPHTVYGVAHSLAYPENGPDRSYYSTTAVPDNNTTYHDYELDWTPTSLTFSIDGQPFYTYTKKADANWHSWPYNQPFYLVIDLAVGGTWAGNDKAQFPGDGVDKSALPTSLNVQSINYYSYLGSK